MLIGAFMPIAAVGYYALATGLSRQVNSILSPVPQVVYPAAAELHAQNDLGRLSTRWRIFEALPGESVSMSREISACASRAGTGAVDDREAVEGSSGSGALFGSASASATGAVFRADTGKLMSESVLPADCGSRNAGSLSSGNSDLFFGGLDSTICWISPSSTRTGVGSGLWPAPGRDAGGVEGCTCHSGPLSLLGKSG